MGVITLISLILPFYHFQPCDSASANYLPRQNIWDAWLETLMNYRLQNMTADLVKDVNSKLMYADKVHNNHKGAPAAILGQLASRIKNKFQDMVNIYRKYSDISVLREANYTRAQMMDAYLVMQNEYHMLKVMGNTFFDTYAQIYHELVEKAKEEARKKRRKKRKKRKPKPKMRAGLDKMREEERRYKSEMRMRKYKEEFVFDPLNPDMDGAVFN